MRSKFSGNLSARLMGGVAAAAMLMAGGQAFAQAADGAVEEVVVTGTAIRGIAPIGANVQSVGQQDIQRIGAMSTNQILANVPVISSQFNTTANTPTSIFLSVFRPNIRNISGSGGNTTLVLVDGHNQVGVGTLQTTPDAGMTPVGASLRRTRTGTMDRRACRAMTACTVRMSVASGNRIVRGV